MPSFACEGKYRRHLRVQRIKCRLPGGQHVSRVLFRSPTCMRCGAERPGEVAAERAVTEFVARLDRGIDPPNQLQSVAGDWRCAMGDVQTAVASGRLFTEADAKLFLRSGEITGWKRRDAGPNAGPRPTADQLLAGFLEMHGDKLELPGDRPVMAMTVGALEALIVFAVARGADLGDKAVREAPQDVLAEWLAQQRQAHEFPLGGTDGG